MMNLLYGFLLGAAIALLAYRAGALTRSGAAAAALNGGIVFGLGGLPWAALLLTFFISSSALSKAFRRQKAALNEKFSKGSRRDWSQVAANGGVAAALAVVHALLPDQNWPWLAYAGALAAVNADTWATELGVLSPHPPRLITTGRLVERGASGAVTLAGTLAAFGGGALVGLVAALFTPAQAGLGGLVSLAGLAGIIAIAGLVGALFDSLLGATVQAIYRCPVCRKETEHHPRHSCGAQTIQVRGWKVMSNEAVNFACSLLGALAAAALGGWIF